MIVIVKSKFGPSTFEDVTNISLQSDYIKLALKTKNNENFTAIYHTKDLAEIKILDF